MIISLCLGLGLAGWVTFREYVADRIEAVALGSGRGGAADEAEVGRWLALCGAVCPARAHEAASQAYVRLALQSTGAARASRLTLARTAAEAGLRRNPLSSEAWARLALIGSQQAGGQATPVAIADLERSYGAAPFSRGASAWRIQFCANHWAALTPSLRKAALAEMTWLGEIKGGDAYRLLTEIRDPFVRQLFEIRVLPPPAE